MATSTRAAPVALIAVGIAVASLLVRTPSLDRVLTIDERLWIERSAEFVDAVGELRFRDAIATGHPGVTTMWIAGLAQETLPDGADLRDRYARARLWMAIVASGLIVLIWWLTSLVLGHGAAAIGGFLLALDPFLIAHNRVVHLDGLLALLMIAGVLALIAALRADDRRLLILSGAMAGLALLTKSPAAYLVLVALIAAWRDGRGIARRMAWWAGPAALVVLALWPVLWVRPWHAASTMLGGGGSAIAETTSSGFFLGGQVGDPGPLFYPVALPMRMTVFVLPVAVATAVWAIRRRGEEPARTVLQLLVYALGFVALITLASKKGDRYALPSLVALDLAAAVGFLWWLRGRRRLIVTALAAALLVHAAPGLSLHPYEISHFNLLTGGPSVARRAMVVAWGEGLDEAAEDLNTLPDAGGTTIATTRTTHFEEFFAGRTIGIEESTLADPAGIRPDFVLFYISNVQTGAAGEAWDRYRDREPFYRLTINGIPYVRVYRVEG